MSAKTLALTDALYDYILSVSLRESPVQKQIREDNQREESTMLMQSSPEQGQLLDFLVKLMGVKNAIEIGVLTGYSSLAVAQAMPDDGRLVACDISVEWTDRAREYWKQAGVDRKIELLIGPASDSLDMLIAQGESGSFDLAFIDADKTGYDNYYERCLTLLRPGGVIAFDNVLWGGSVIDQQNKTDDTQAIRALNAKLHSDERVDITLIPIGDGLTLARKR